MSSAATAGPAAGGRQPLHTRRIELQGWRLDDGRYEVEARLTDVKAIDLDMFNGSVLPAGRPLHGMGIRMRVDADLRIEAIEATMDATPYRDCRAAAPNLGRLTGLKIQPGFLREAQRRLAGIDGCTHLRELLQQLATTVIQTAAADPLRKSSMATGNDAAGERPKLIDSCMGYRSDGEAVRIRWPQFLTPARPDRP